ncbi:hypothetical protein FEF26_14965 [Nesterenkonia salmonea]|uniref:DUF6602 domain-containing protein n=1 Tax=Nesterenkonia salmonea TaxID=1804987 RepID=A0A5R9B9C1_9MICC|nr:DUF6602 domain-containing protein [Nesterenkonia salmonea]TLP92232.1 hypothetical protein FEF26_14965 [Nesterenkonia salmonea]
MSELADLMSAASQDMASQVKGIRAAFDHQLSKGEAAEATLRKFFEDYYPSSIGVAHGQVVDSYGSHSKQHDVILYDTTQTPVLYTDKQRGARLLPVEGVIAVIESKLSLQLAHVEQAVESARTLKSLDRSAYYLPEKLPGQIQLDEKQKAYGTEYDVIPPMYFLFAFEGSAVTSFAQRLEDRQKDLPVDKRVDLVCVMEDGVVVNVTTRGQIDTLPSPGSHLTGYKTEHALFLFHMLVSRYLLQVKIPDIALQRYIPKGFTF